MKATTFPEFEELARAQHHNRYTYKPDGFTDACGKVTVICSDHGEFVQRAGDHMKGHGCPACGKIKVLETKKAKAHLHLQELQQVHPNYEFPEYTQNFTKVTDKCLVVCSEHGPFSMSTHHLKRGKGCRQCGVKRAAKSKEITLEAFKLRVGDTKCQYKDSTYLGYNLPMTMVCGVHGDFQQTPAAHATRGARCPRCSWAANSQIVKQSPDELLARCLEVHKGADYTYPEKLEGLTQTWTITCKAHGDFRQLGYVHLRGSRCPRCASVGSVGQRDMFTYIKSICPDAVPDYRFSKNHRQQIDVYVPSLKIGFEYHGIFWHSSKNVENNYHLEKQELAKLEGIALYQIFSDEWGCEVAKKLIAAKLSKTQSIYARVCTVVEVQDEEAQRFHEANHIQGWKRRGRSWGLAYQGELVALMTFTAVSSHRGAKSQQGHYELARFSSTERVVGGASRLLSAAVTAMSATSIVSYSDNRLFSGGMYVKLGFSSVHVTPPSYSYVAPNQEKRAHKSHFRHSKLREKLGDSYDPAKTEKVNCESAGYYQVYDCGLTKWLWKAQKTPILN
jgi:hypothetical protein